MSIRAIHDREIQIRDRLNETDLASLSYDDALRDVHPNAIYHHQGEKYEVVDLDLERDTAFLESTELSYYTQALTDKAISVNEVLNETTLATHPGVTVGFADIEFREQVTKYLQCTQGNDDNGEPIPLPEPLPPTELGRERCISPFRRLLSRTSELRAMSTTDSRAQSTRSSTR